MRTVLGSLVFAALLLLLFDQLVVAQQDSASATSEQEALETPNFDSLKELHAYFEPLRGELATQWQDFERKSQRDEETFDALREKERTLWERERSALKLYVDEHQSAPDALEARHGAVVIAARLGLWKEVVAEADLYLKHYEGNNADLARMITYSRAEALFHIEGRENEAMAAFEAVIRNYPGYLEERLARELLIVTFTYLDRISDAKKLVRQTMKMPITEEDPAAKEYLQYELEKLNKVGEKFPDFLAHRLDGTSVESDEVIGGKPVLIWYWDSQVASTLVAWPQLRDLAKTYAEKIKVVALSVETQREVWRQEAEKLSADSEHIEHLYEGAYGSERSAEGLMEQMPLPMAVLVDRHGKIHRLDVPSFDLERVIKLWLK